MKLRVGNKQNSILNGEWASHVKKDMKKYTSSIRRQEDKRIIRDELEDKEFDKGKSKKKKEKVWIVEEQSIRNSNYIAKYGKFATAKDAIKSAKTYYNYMRNGSEFWRNFYANKIYRVRNTETGEIVSVQNNL